MPPSDKVLTGADHWLFLQNDSSRVLEQHTGARGMPREHVEAWTSALSARVAWAGERGIPYRCLFAPDPHGVYRDKLPASVQAQLTYPSRRPLPTLLDRLPEHVRRATLYPVEALTEARQVCDTYHKTDTHWNGYGAFVAYERLVAGLSGERLRMDPLRDEDVEFFLQTREGDLGSKLEPVRSSKCILVRPRPNRSRIVYDNKLVNNGWTRVFRRDDADAGERSRCLIFGDSFIGSMIPLLAPTFGETVAVHTSRRFEFALAEALEPDVVLTIGVERFAIDPPDDDDDRGESLRETIERKRTTGATTGAEVGAFPYDGAAATLVGVGPPPEPAPPDHVPDPDQQVRR